MYTIKSSTPTLWWCPAGIAAIVLGLCILPCLVQNSPEKMVSCTVGSYWVYDVVNREQIDENKLQTTKKREKLTVIDAVSQPGIEVALVERRDLSGQDPVAHTVRLVFDNSRFYEYDLSEEQMKTEWPDLKKSVASGERQEEPDESSLMMELPAKLGTNWDQEGSPDRKDKMYCWCVEKIQTIPALTGIGGAPLWRNATEYTIAFRTCPDHQLRKFVNGIGFVDMQYRHHGTVIESDEHLLEFHKG